MSANDDGGRGLPTGGHGVPSGETVTLTADQLKARSRRNVWIALAVSAFVVLVFFITIAKLQAGQPV